MTAEEIAVVAAEVVEAEADEVVAVDAARDLIRYCS